MDNVERPTPEPTQALPPTNRPQPEPTQVIPPAVVSADPLADAAKRRAVEAELTKLGLNPEEVRRLLNANAHTADVAPSALPKPALIPPVLSAPTSPKKADSQRVTADSLQAFAAQLKAEKDAVRQVAISTAGQRLPEFRESSVQEARAAEALLRDANVLRRREKFVEAEAKCREALLLVPKDGSALEMLGDILQGVARVDEALAAYRRALEADKRRSSAEKKYADLLMRQERWDSYDSEIAPPNLRFSVLLSLLLPGAGQFFYGNPIKGGLFLALDVVCIYLLGFSPWGFSGSHPHHGISPGLIAIFAFAIVVYIGAAVDTISEGKRAG